MKQQSASPKSTRIFVVFNRLCYATLGLSLIAIALALIFGSLSQAWHAYSGGSKTPVIDLLDAIGLLVISMAALDSGKYLMEEEVLRDRELRSALEARQTLTKFLVIITIAVSLEAVVAMARVDADDLQLLVYPAILLLSGVAVVLGLGIYQKLSGAVEAKDRATPANNR